MTKTYFSVNKKWYNEKKKNRLPGEDLIYVVAPFFSSSILYIPFLFKEIFYGIVDFKIHAPHFLIFFL